MTKCSLFQKNSTLLVSPNRVQSSVFISVFGEFVSALEENVINITNTNFTEFHRLCDEFAFSEIAAKLSEFRPSMDFKEVEDSDARGRIAALEEKVNQHSHIITMLQDEVTQLSTDYGRLAGEVSPLRSAAAGIQTLSKEVSALKTQIAEKLSDPVVEQRSTDFSELRQVSTRKAQMTVTVPSPVAVPPSPPKLSAPSFDGRIISEFPEIFAEFRVSSFFGGRSRLLTREILTTELESSDLIHDRFSYSRK
jgi:FtsZ-binding cell division protein ZapB